MHKNIKRFTVDGLIKDDKDFIRLRSQFEYSLWDEMRLLGYVPVLDLGTYFSTEFLEDKYKFILTSYGVYIGKIKSWEYEGYTNGKLIPRNIVKSK